MLKNLSGRDFFDDAIDASTPQLPADADALAQQSFVDSVSPEVSASDSIRFRSKSATASITGVPGATISASTASRWCRRHLPRRIAALQEVIIDDNARRGAVRHFGVEPLGQIVFLGSVPAPGGRRKSERNLCPTASAIDALQRTVMRMVGKTTLSGIASAAEGMTSPAKPPSAPLRSCWPSAGVKDFMTFNRDQFRKSIERTSMTLSLLILMVASISLVIGSFGRDEHHAGLGDRTHP